MKDLYPIQDDDQDYYSAGILPNGNQILCGQGGPYFVAVEFSPDGDYLRIFETVIPPHLLQEHGNGRYFPIDHERFEEEFERWKQCLGFSSSTLFVRPFFIEGSRIGIRDYPEYMQEEAATGDADAVEWIQEWEKSGSFVLYWGNDYFLGPEGDVESS